jgi:uridine kinase
MAVTPSMTPAMDIKVLIEMKACFCFARRYRRPTKSSNDMMEVPFA